MVIVLEMEVVIVLEMEVVIVLGMAVVVVLEMEVMLDSGRFILCHGSEEMEQRLLPPAPRLRQLGLLERGRI